MFIIRWLTDNDKIENTHKFFATRPCDNVAGNVKFFFKF